MKPLRLPHPRLAAHLGVVLVAWCAPGCFISFDGYTPAAGNAGAESGGVEGARPDSSGVGPGGSGNESGQGQSAADAAAGDAGEATGNDQGGAAPAGAGGLDTGGANTSGAGAGGTATGGIETGGQETGGTQTGGVDAAGANAGGVTTGGVTTGGVETGGVETGGVETGGVETGGVETGGGDAGGAASGGDDTGGSGTGGGPACPVGLAGPVMTEIPRPDGGYFCIDRTEVTNAQYADFVALADAAEQPTYCSFNASFAPESSADCPALRYDPIGRAQYPVSCVDWCDAYAFCTWAGKHLCADVSGGPVAPAEFANAGRDQWYVACSRGGTQLYPYAGDYQAEGCVDQYYPAVYPVETATVPACEGGYANVFDLSGNVSEWEDSCSATSGASDTCVHRGGSYLDADDSSPSVRCNSADADDPETVTPALRARQSRSISVGFRCCWDP